MKNVHGVCVWLCVLVSLCRASPVRESAPSYNAVTTTVVARDKRQMQDIGIGLPQTDMKVYATPVMTPKETPQTPFGQFTNYAGLLFSGYPALLGNAIGAPLPSGAALGTGPNVVIAPGALPTLPTLPPTQAAGALPTNFPGFPAGNNNSNFGNPFYPYPPNANMYQGNLYGGGIYPPPGPLPLQSAQGQFAALEQLVNMANLQGLGPQFGLPPPAQYAIRGPGSIRVPPPYAPYAPYATPIVPGPYYTPTRYGPAF